MTLGESAHLKVMSNLNCTRNNGLLYVYCILSIPTVWHYIKEESKFSKPCDLTFKGCGILQPIRSAETSVSIGSDNDVYSLVDTGRRSGATGHAQFLFGEGGRPGEKVSQPSTERGDLLTSNNIQDVIAAQRSRSVFFFVFFIVFFV